MTKSKENETQKPETSNRYEFAEFREVRKVSLLEAGHGFLRRLHI
jgi:hypothetical protein